MEARIDAGDPVPPGFVRDLALLRSFLDLPGRTDGPRFEQQKVAECDYTRRSIAGLTRRRPSTAGLSAALVALEDPPDPSCEASLVPLLGKDPAASHQAFLALPRRDPGAAPRLQVGRDPRPLDPAGSRSPLRELEGQRALSGRRRRRAPSARRARPFSWPHPRHRGDPDGHARPRPGDACLPRRAPGAGARRGAARALGLGRERGARGGGDEPRRAVRLDAAAPAGPRSARPGHGLRARGGGDRVPSRTRPGGRTAPSPARLRSRPRRSASRPPGGSSPRGAGTRPSRRPPSRTCAAATPAS